MPVDTPLSETLLPMVCRSHLFLLAALPSAPAAGFAAPLTRRAVLVSLAVMAEGCRRAACSQSPTWPLRSLDASASGSVARKYSANSHCGKSHLASSVMPYDAMIGRARERRGNVGMAFQSLNH